MKKMYKYILIITIMLFGFIDEARANEELNDCVSKGSCQLLCSYKSSEGNAYIYRYVRSSTDSYYISSFNWGKEVKRAYIFNDGDGITPDGIYDFAGGGAAEMNTTAFIDKKLIANNREFICPLKVYKNEAIGKEICFDNDDGYCKGKGLFGNKFKKAMSGVEVISEEKEEIKDVNLSAIEAKNKIQDYFNDRNDKSKIVEVCAFNNTNILDGTADQYFIVTLKDKFRVFRNYVASDNNKFREILEGDDSMITWSITIEYNAWGGSCIGISSIFEVQSAPFGDVYVSISDREGGIFSESTEYTSDGNPYDSFSMTIEDNDHEKLSCEGLIGETLIEEINSYLLYIKIAVPIIIIVMGSLDFGKAFISSDEEAMKKAQKRFIMRLIIGLVIFFVPALINVLLKIANEVWNISSGTCDITF